jgi:hypothetical protein
MYKYFFLVWLLAGCTFAAIAQNPDTAKKSAVLKRGKDTLMSTKHDTVVARSFKPKVKKEKVFHPDSTHDPHTAFIHSLIVPGWGQIYNHRIWKVPLIYGGLGSFVAAIIFNTSNYNLFLQLAKYRADGTQPKPTDKIYPQYQAYSIYTDQAIYDANDYYRRTRDLCILGFVGFWGINVVDAYIDAKFIHSYTIDNNLSIKIRPGLLNQPAYAQNFSSSYIPAIKITFALR